jgi:hypothetical protein
MQCIDLMHCTTQCYAILDHLTNIKKHDLLLTFCMLEDALQAEGPES